MGGLAVPAEQRAPRPARMDGAGPLGVLVTLPWLLSLLGIDVRGALLGVAVLFLGLASVVAASTARRPGEPAGPWRAYALAAAMTAVGVVVGLPCLGAPAMVAGLALHLAPRLRWIRAERLLGALQLALPVVAATIYFGGTAILAADLSALLLAALLTAAWRRTQDRAVARRLLAVTALALLADAVASAHLSASLHAVQGWVLAGAALSERPALRHAEARDTPVAVPVAALAAFPLMLGWAVLMDGAGAWPLAWFASTGVATLVVVCARHAVVAASLRREVAAERALRIEAERREHPVRDPLTGAYNRRFFDEALENEVQRARRYDTGAALILLAIDGAPGDDVLCTIARTADELLRPADAVARTGDAEFALLLPETGRGEAMLVADRLREALTVGVRTGVAACPEDAETRDGLLQAAVDDLVAAVAART